MEKIEKYIKEKRKNRTKYENNKKRISKNKK